MIINYFFLKFVTVIKFVYFFRQPETVVRLYMLRDHSINLISTDVGRRPAHAYEIN